MQGLKRRKVPTQIRIQKYQRNIKTYKPKKNKRKKAKNPKNQQLQRQAERRTKACGSWAQREIHALARGYRNQLQPMATGSWNAEGCSGVAH